jgi:hypothetical protein
LLIFQFDVIMSLKTGIDTSIRWVSSFSWNHFYSLQARPWKNVLASSLSVA